MTSKHVKIGHISLTLTDVVAIKVALSVALIAVFYVPAPWDVPLAISANMVWVWRL
jgi:hypothetical protein